MKKNEPYIIPFAKRKKFDIVFAAVAVLILGVAMAFIWYAVANGAGDAMTIAVASLFTISFGCSLVALITGRMAWLLVGYILPY